MAVPHSCPPWPHPPCSLTGFIPVVLYLSYMGLLVWCLFLAMGTIGFLSSFIFTYAIFNASKSVSGRRGAGVLGWAALGRVLQAFLFVCCSPASCYETTSGIRLDWRPLLLRPCPTAGLKGGLLCRLARHASGAMRCAAPAVQPTANDLLRV